MRVLLDSNVLISGLLPRDAPPGRLLRAWLDDRFVLVTSRAQLDELRVAFTYPRLRTWIPEDLAALVLETLDTRAVVVADLPTLDVSSDPDDNPILATAVAGEADLIVSGDRKGMRDLGEVEGISIVTARAAVERLRC